MLGWNAKQDLPSRMNLSITAFFKVTIIEIDEGNQTGEVTNKPVNT